jgi:DNA-binding NarL/FixJ family response regulator
MQRSKVLIVDDNELFRKALAKFMKRQQKFQVIKQAANGDEAVALTQRLHPDLVLMDISMPGMSGVEAAQRIKQRFPGIKIVFVTIHDEETYQTLVKSLNFDGFVCKSSLKRDLPRVLQQIKAP